MKLGASLNTKVWVAFATSVMLVGVLALTAWLVAQDDARALQRVTQAHQVLDSLIRTQVDSLQIELSTQNFRITGDLAHRTDMTEAIAHRQAMLELLRQLLQGETEQMGRWNRLNGLVADRLAMARTIETLRINQGQAAASAYAASAPLRETRTRMFGLLQEMEHAQRLQLAQRSAAQAAVHEYEVVAVVVVTILLGLLLCAIYAGLRQQLHKAALVRQALADSKQHLRQQNASLEALIHQQSHQLRESEEHLLSVMAHVPALIAYVDAQQRYAYVNARYHESTAPQLTDIHGLTVREVVGEKNYAVAEPRIARVLAGQKQQFDYQTSADTWHDIQYVPRLDSNKAVIGYYVMGTDISERKRTEQRIGALNAELEHRVHQLENVSRALKTLSAGNRTMLHAQDEQSLLDNMCQAIAQTGRYAMSVVCYCNDDEDKTMRAMAQFGFATGLAGLQSIKNSWADNEYGRGPVAISIRSGRPCIVRNLHADANYAPFRSSMGDYASGIACPLRVQGRIIGAIGIYAAEADAFGSEEERLMTELADDLAFGIQTLREKVEKENVENAMHLLTSFDALTGLPNGRYFSELVTGAIHSSKVLNQSFALIQTNIERLSEINDALGFNQGDRLLQEFGARLRSATSNSAMVARLRGDEFAVLLPATDESTASQTARDFERAFARPFTIAEIPLELSARIGIAMFPQHGATAHDLFRNVDIAVHQAKKRGVGWSVFTELRASDQSRRLTLAGELRRAIEGGDLRIYLQPKAVMATGELCGAEALVRWQHTERGMIPPGEFIELAEHTGLIKPLTNWVVDAVLQVHKDWGERGCALPIAVNISARNLHDENFEPRIRQLLQSQQLPSGLLEMEITESAIMDDAEFALGVLHALCDQSVPLYVDDFGTGYSSLSYLQKLPVQYIKIDQSFVRDMTTNRDSAAIVRSTIDLAHDLGHKVVAEGVETQEHWDCLLQFGCDIAQGYFIARPMPIDAFLNWTKTWRA